MASDGQGAKMDNTNMPGFDFCDSPYKAIPEHPMLSAKLGVSIALVKGEHRGTSFGGGKCATSQRWGGHFVLPELLLALCRRPAWGCTMLKLFVHSLGRSFVQNFMSDDWSVLFWGTPLCGLDVGQNPSHSVPAPIHIQWSM
eukprot:5178420-Amphidinium_carterae.1